MNRISAVLGMALVWTYTVGGEQTRHATPSDGNPSAERSTAKSEKTLGYAYFQEPGKSTPTAGHQVQVNDTPDKTSFRFIELPHAINIMAVPNKDETYSFDKKTISQSDSMTIEEATSPRGVRSGKGMGESRMFSFKLKTRPVRQIYAVRSSSANTDLDGEDSDKVRTHYTTIFDENGNYVVLQTEAPVAGSTADARYYVVKVVGNDPFGFNTERSARLGKLSDPVLELSVPKDPMGKPPTPSVIQAFTERMQNQQAAIKAGTHKKDPYWIIREKIAQSLTTP